MEALVYTFLLISTLSFFGNCLKFQLKRTKKVK